MKLNKHDKIEIFNLLHWKNALKKAIKNGSYKNRIIDEMEEKVEFIENKCPECGYISKYNKKHLDDALQEKGEIVIRAVCKECGYKSEIVYKQII